MDFECEFAWYAQTIITCIHLLSLKCGIKLSIMGVVCARVHSWVLVGVLVAQSLVLCLVFVMTTNCPVPSQDH